MNYNADLNVKLNTTYIREGLKQIKDVEKTLKDVDKSNTKPKVDTSDVKNAQREFDRLKDKLDKFDKASGAIKGGGLAAIGAATGPIGAAGLAVGALGAVVSALGVNAIQTADQIAHMSARVRVSTEELSAFKYAAEMSGADLTVLEQGLNKVNKMMADAAKGNEKAAQTLDLLGINYDSTKGRVDTTTEAFLKISDATAYMTDDLDKAAVRAMVFGDKIGPKLTELLDNGSIGIRKFAEEARKAGLIVSSDFAKNATQFNDNMEKIKKNAEAIGMALAETLLPALNDFTAWIADESNKKQIREMISLVGDLVDVIRLVSKANNFVKNLSVTGVIGQAYSQYTRKDEPAAKPKTTSLFADIKDFAGQAALQFEALRVAATIKSAKDIEEAKKREAEAIKAAAKAKRAEAAAAKEAADKNREYLNQSLSSWQDSLKAQEDAKDRMNDALGSWQDELARTREQFEYLQAMLGGEDALRALQLSKDLRWLKEALDQGAISLEEYADAKKRLEEKAAGPNGIRGFFEELNINLDSIGDGLANTIADGLERGKIDFKRFVAEVGQMLLRAGLSKLIGIGLDALFPSAGAAVGSAHGNVFDKGSIKPFASGGIVDRFTSFPMKGGIGIAGEAGPEAIMPLSRGRDGRLGVQVSGGSAAAPTITMVNNITVEGGDDPRRTADEMARALDRLMETKFKRLLANEFRSGNSLSPAIQQY